MSQYLTVGLKKKDNPKVKISLWWVCTTPARRMNSKMNAFPYTQDDVLLDKETYFNYLDNIKEYIDEQKESKKKYESEMETYNLKLPLAANKEVYEAIKEDISDCKSMIKVFDDDIAEYTNYFNELNFIWIIYDDNIKEWDIYYSNC